MKSFFEIADDILAKEATAFALYTDQFSYLGWGEGKSDLCRLNYRFFHSTKQSGDALWSDFSHNKNISPLDARHFSKGTPPTTFPRLASRPREENHTAWMQLCTKASKEIIPGALQKVVLTRQGTCLLTNEELELVSKNIFSRICALSAPDTYRFAVKSGSSLFFGATPELLFHRKDGKIFVPSIAGTLAVNAEDGDRNSELFNSEKDRGEHRFVVDGIAGALRSLGLKPEHPTDPIVRKFGKLLHLFTPIQCEDPGKNVLSSESLIEVLHPTPAIGGTPKNTALDFLAQNEGWSRGLFASPLLFTTQAEEICLVAIRSGLLRDSKLHFFAGAGFVRESEPHKEWLETENKMNALSNMFFGSAQC